MNCSNCQNPIREGEKFCGKCGRKMKQGVFNDGKEALVINQKKAVIAFLLGLFGILLLFFPFIVLIITPITLFFGFKGLRSSKRYFAILGIIFALLSLVSIFFNWKNSFCQNIFNLTDSCPKMCDLGMLEGGLDGKGPMYLRYSCDYVGGPKNIFESIGDKIDLIYGNQSNF
jgi:hypothetical protein